MSAIFSECGKYRYKLSRSWDEELPKINVIMYNPSIANADVDDPTIKSLTRILKNHGFGAFNVYNMWAYISTDPDAIKSLPFSVARGENHKYLASIPYKEPVLFAWGTMGYLGNSDTLRFDEKEVWCLGQNKNGSPKHPLYLSAKTQMQKYTRGIK